MNLDEYSKNGFKLYLEFANNIKSFLEKAIKEKEFTSSVLLVQARAKEKDSLKKKLEPFSNEELENIENCVKDLAGCRVILYTNSHVNKFIESGILVSEYFSIKDNKYKYHFPMNNNDPKYEANHYIVSLNDKLISSREYKNFKGFECEIQIHTILNHVWAERTHDIIYKKQGFSEYGSEIFNSIEKKADKLYYHLLDAEYLLQKIECDKEKLLEEKDFIAEGGLEQLRSCKNNDDRHDILVKYKEFVLPFQKYKDQENIKISQQLVEVIEVARKSDETPIHTVAGITSRQSYLDIIQISIYILVELPYIDMEKKFSLLCELFVSRKSDLEIDQILNAIEQISCYKYVEENKFNLFDQFKICRQIEKFSEKQYKLLTPVIIRSLSTILEIKMIRFTTLPYDENLVKLRVEAFKLFETLYLLVNTEQRTDIFYRMWERIRIRQPKGLSNELEIMILNDATRLIQFCLINIENEHHRVLQIMEHSFFTLYCDYHSSNCDNELSKTIKELFDGITKFQELLNKNREYVIYKIFVGSETVYSHEWEKASIDNKKQDSYRKQKIENIIKCIQFENSKKWLKRMIYYSKIETNDFNQYFLRMLGEKKPVIIVQWIENLDENLKYFLESMLIGLFKSSKKNLYYGIIQKWIKNNYNLQVIAIAQQKVDEPDLPLLWQVVDVAKEKNDSKTLSEILVIAAKNCIGEKNKEFQKMGLICIRECTKQNGINWVKKIYRYIHSSFFNNLSDKKVKIILRNIELFNEIDFYTEKLLNKLIENNPNIILKMFVKRLKIEQKLCQTNYIALPDKFELIGNILKKFPKEVINQTKKYFIENDDTSKYGVEKLIRAIYPKLSKDLKSELQKEICSSENNIDFVIQILLTCKWNCYSYTILKTVISKLKEDDIRVKKLEQKLMDTGVVDSSHEIYEIYEKRKNKIENWKNDENPMVKKFADNITHKLDIYMKRDKSLLRD